MKQEPLTALEWRKLGFYCDPPDNSTWRFVGSRAGLMNFVQLLREYVRHLPNSMISEHDHYGPYGWLEVMTYERPVIDDHAIAGSLKDLERLAGLVERGLQAARPSETFTIGPEYSAESTRTLSFEVREDGFDPASADRWASKVVPD